LKHLVELRAYHESLNHFLVSPADFVLSIRLGIAQSVTVCHSIAISISVALAVSHTDSNTSNSYAEPVCLS
jgi:hypothetical protein